MFKSKLFLTVACITLLLVIALIVMQILEMREFNMF